MGTPKPITYESRERRIRAARMAFYRAEISSVECAARVAALEARPVVAECGSGWTNDRCTKPLGHRGFHSNE
jgi:hypothetical protein